MQKNKIILPRKNFENFDNAASSILEIQKTPISKRTIEKAKVGKFYSKRRNRFLNCAEKNHCSFI